MTFDFCKLTCIFLKLTYVDNVDNFVEKVNNWEKLSTETDN